MTHDDHDLQARVQRERDAHSQRDVLAANKRIQGRFPHLKTYPSRARMDARMAAYLDDLHGKVVLDYGCGRGAASLRYLQSGGIVHGIDISAQYVESARQAAQAAGFAPERYAFQVMDAHALTFDDHTFDLVVGHGILHHLAPDRALDEIHRVLKPRGRVLLHEPLADNPLLKIFRLLTPHARTADERPFSGQDLKRLTTNQRWETALAYCGLIETPTALVTSILMRSHSDNAPLRLADSLETWTHHRRLLLPWNQYVLFDMRKID